jgi:flagellar basal body-associated protein FliL
MEFLYFPEDKTEYIPAIITLVIFMVLAAFTMYWFIKRSKKEEEAFNEKYHQGEYKAKDETPQTNKNK